MRIGFDVAQTCAERAGCAWYADSLLRAMVEVAPDNDYLVYHQFGTWINPETTGGTFIEHASVRMPFWGIGADKSRLIWNRAGTQEALPGDPEIVQSNSFQAIPTGAAKLVFVIYDVSFWVYPEFTTESNRLQCQMGTLEALNRADGFIFISESARNDFDSVLPGWLDRSGKPVAAIPLASRLRPTNGFQPGESFWLAVGSMEPRKNYEALFSALELYWERSRRPSPVQIAASTGWKNDQIRTKARELESKGRIRTLGYLNEHRLSSLYEQALGLVFPSWYEGFGLPILEAMQCGCPVICSDRSSLPEVGKDVPIYIDPARPESICNAMIALEEDGELRKSRAEAGKRRARQFNWSKTAQATLEFYRKVLGN
jgi:glycosyltransferase involved in cell wall biosynthesis